MPHTIKPLPFKPPRLQGISAEQIESLYENQYGLELRRLNEIEAQFQETGTAKNVVLDTNRRHLHERVSRFELHFSGLGENPEQPLDDLKAAIHAQFRSIHNWRDQLVSLLPSDSAHAGWLILAWCNADGKLKNRWLDYDTLTPEPLIPILVISIHSNAYQIDFGEDRVSFVDTYLHNANWGVAQARFGSKTRGQLFAEEGVSSTPQISVETLTAQIEKGKTPIILDVRLKEDIRPDETRISGSSWFDPQQVSNWGTTLPKDRPIVVYCMYGFWVSQDTTAALTKLGISAKALSGGMSAWRALGSAIEPFD